MGKKYYIKREYIRIPNIKRGFLLISYYKERSHKTLHREGGPALFTVGAPCNAQQWIINNMMHREDGPAVTDVHGKQEYWLNGKQIKEEEFIWRNCFKNNQ